MAIVNDQSHRNAVKGETSATAVFLERMEAARLKRECILILDMRGKVPGVCQKYLHKGREFYLDDISHSLFQKGLSENSGVFTVGTYEAIINGSHTLKAIRQRTENNTSAVGGGGQSVAPQNMSIPDEHPFDVIDFGYYRRRAEDRLEYATDVIIEYEGVRYPAKTRNLSVNGLQLVMTHIPGFVPLERAYLTFVELNKTSDVLLELVPFTVMKCEYRKDTLNLSLRRDKQDDQDAIGKYFKGFIEQSKQKYKLDIEDEIVFVNAMLHRRLYAESSAQVPMFMSHNPDGWRVETIGHNRNNLSTLNFFDLGNGRYDMSPFILPHRAQCLGKMMQGAVQDGLALLVVYRKTTDAGGAIHSFFNLEMSDYSQFINMLRLVSQQAEYRVFKMDVCAINMPDQRKLALFVDSLMSESETEASRLKDAIATYSAMATLSDITQAVKDTLLSRTVSQSAMGPGEDNYMVWVGNEMVQMTGGMTVRRIPSGEWSQYEEVPFGYYKRRTEERYLLSSDAECHWSDRDIEVKTVDVSVHGLLVLLDQPYKFQINDDVLVTFTELQKLVAGVKLKKVPYKVKYISTNGRQVGLARILEVKTKEVSLFLADLFQRNQGKLERDYGDGRTESTARLLECMFSEHNNTIPFFMCKAPNGVINIDKIALINHESRLVKFFLDADGDYDFSALTEVRRMARLVDYLHYVRRQPDDPKFPKSQKMLVYLYRDLPATQAGSKITALTDDDISGVMDKKSFIRQLSMKPDFIIINLSITPVNMLVDAELDKIIDPIVHAAKHRAIKLREDVRSIVGVGEMQDLTDLFMQ